MRWSQGEAGKTVLDGASSRSELRRRQATIRTEPRSSTRSRSAASRRHRSTRSIRGGSTCWLALHAARRTGTFRAEGLRCRPPRRAAQALADAASGWNRKPNACEPPPQGEADGEAGGAEPGTEARGGRVGRRAAQTLRTEDHDEEADRRRSRDAARATSSPRTSSSSRRCSPSWSRRARTEPP